MPSSRLHAGGAEVLRADRDKDESDTELALEASIDRGLDPVVIVGALGGERIDHELANLLLLAHPRLDGLDVTILDGRATIRRIGTDGGPGSIELVGAPGDLVTLLALAGAVEGVTTRGLRYPLRGELLPPGPARGLSNELLETSAGVTTTRGRLLVDPHPHDCHGGHPMTRRPTFHHAVAMALVTGLLAITPAGSTTLAQSPSGVAPSVPPAGVHGADGREGPTPDARLVRAQPARARLVRGADRRRHRRGSLPRMPAVPSTRPS